MQLMHIDEVVGFIIQQYFKERGNKECMSRHRLACTRCRALTSSTWRPGPVELRRCVMRVVSSILLGVCVLV